VPEAARSTRGGKRKIWLWVLAAVLVLGAAAVAYRFRMRRIVEMGSPEIALFVHREPTQEEVDALFTGAKYEPRYGAYLGAYIDLDPALKDEFKDEIGRIRKLPEEFEQAAGRKHALYFFYLGYGRPLPNDWIKRLHESDYYVQIALEPNKGLEQVQDDEYLKDFADQLGASEAKIFLRFASEMNGPWTVYHGDPDLYIEKWRLVTRVMRERAPNVAMLWCPYMVPKRLIEPYYPGDEWVDWVGVNFYSVTYYNQHRLFPGYNDHPADMLDWMYERYADRKPIMICEYGAANFSALENADTSAFAAEAIQALYAALPRKFPRVKCVTYFSSNNLLLSHRLNNDYSLVGRPIPLRAYSQAILPEYYLSFPGDPVEQAPMPLRERETIIPGQMMSVFARSPYRAARWEVTLDGKTIAAGVAPADIEFVFPEGVRVGSAALSAAAFDSRDRKVAERSYQIDVGEALPKP
jgi:hypothetical protein